jgi:hypothetical protein
MCVLVGLEIAQQTHGSCARVVTAASCTIACLSDWTGAGPERRRHLRLPNANVCYSAHLVSPLFYAAPAGSLPARVS